MVVASAECHVCNPSPPKKKEKTELTQWKIRPIIEVPTCLRTVDQEGALLRQCASEVSIKRNAREMEEEDCLRPMDQFVLRTVLLIDVMIKNHTHP
jgi:hypothetical protein